MLLVYPGSLGLDEAINGLSLKIAGSVLAQCTGGDDYGCTHPLLYVSIATLLTAALATVWWLRVVYARYETTLALPIEYGVVNVCMVLSGLLVFGEAEYMDAWQLGLVCGGSALVTLGILVVHRPKLPCCARCNATLAPCPKVAPAPALGPSQSAASTSATAPSAGSTRTRVSV